LRRGEKNKGYFFADHPRPARHFFPFKKSSKSSQMFLDMPACLPDNIELKMLSRRVARWFVFKPKIPNLGKF
jgi:hypothetical protein